MSSAPGQRLKLYNSIADFNEGKSSAVIKDSELLKQRRVLIISKKWAANSILKELAEEKALESKDVMLINFTTAAVMNSDLSTMISTNTLGFIFILSFLSNPNVLATQEARRAFAYLGSLINSSFYCSVDYENFKKIPLNEAVLKTFVIAELISEEKSQVQEEEFPISFQSQEQVFKEILDQQTKNSPPTKRSKKSFESISTKYNDVFREVINDIEYDELRQTENFVLEEEREHYRTFEKLQTNPEREKIKKEADALKFKFENAKLSIEEFDRTFKDHFLWKPVKLIAFDLSREINFRELDGRLLPGSYQHYPEYERLWILELLSTFSSPEEKITLTYTLANYIEYFEAPEKEVYIFEESVKKQIIESIFEKAYTSIEFASLFWTYFESLTQNNPRNSENMGYFVAAVLMHPKIKAIWNPQLPQEKPLSPTFNNGRTIGKYSPDEASEEDHLDFKHDVHALAALIAYEQTPLPLAIGLFGNWGSGKSSFMRQLYKRIDYLSDKQYANFKDGEVPDYPMPYCSKIVHIPFNAWHYSDANLWASMMVHIFDHLLAKISVAKTRTELRGELLKKLTTASEAVIEAEKKVAETVTQLSQATQALLTIKYKRKAIDEQLDEVQLSLKDLLGTLMKDEQFKSEIQKLVDRTGYNKTIETKEQLQEWKEEIDSFGERWKRVFKNTFKFSGRNALFFVLLIALPAVVIAVAAFLESKGWLQHINKAVTGIIAFIIPFSARIIDQVRKLNSSLRLVEEKQKDAAGTLHAELKEKEKGIAEEIKKHEAKMLGQKKQVAEAKKKKEEAKAALEAIDINRQLSSFIEQRQVGNSYQQHLGIISMIRKDFEELGKYLKACLQEKQNKDRIIDRIVLYIDDLDRCKTDRVVAVLEAVHLLLALDLFVVVVGVDPRWVSKALKEQYKEQLHLDTEEDSDTSKLPGQRATPFDYLEKIFQVPFVLRPMDNSGAKKLLDNLFKDQVKIIEKVSEPTPDFGELNDPQNTGNPNMKDPFNEKNLSPGQKEAFEKTAREMEEQFNKQQQETELKKQQEEEAKKEFIEQVENLSISEDELAFMKSITPIIGSTPRTVKRYGNLYRLLRVHSDIPDYSEENLPVYQSVMLLLSISVSNGSIARPFFDALKNSGKTSFLEVNTELVENIAGAIKKIDGKDEESLEKLDALNEQWQALTQLKSTLEKMPDAIKNFSVKKLRAHSHVVSRFSFRTLNCAEAEEN